MASLLQWLGNTAKKVERQVNPFDGGATWSHPAAPQNSQPQQPTRYAPPQQGGMSVQPVQQAPLAPPTPPAFHVIPTANLQVHVAPPQPLQVGNQTIQPSPQARSGVQAPPPPPNLAHQVATGLNQKLAPTRQALSFAQQNVVQPFGHAAGEIVATGLNHTITPPKIIRPLTGNQPIKTIPADVRGVYQAVKAGHQNLLGGIPISPKLAAPYAVADAVLHIGSDAPIAGAGLKAGAKQLERFNTSAVGQKAVAALEKVPVGLGTKPVSDKPAGLSKAELGGMAKQNFTPDLINKAHLQAGGKLDANGAPIASDGKPSVPVAQSAPTPKRTYNPSLIPQTSQEGKITKITSFENRANKIGVSGQGALQTMRNAELGEKQHFQSFVDTTKPFYSLKPAEQAIAIKVQKGEDTTNSKAIQAGADSLKSMFRSAHQGITATGKKVGNLGENYFPVHYPAGWFDKPENFNRAVQQMVASGKANNLEDAVSKMQKLRIEGSLKPTEFGNFKTRETNLPGGQENANVVTQYMRGASKAIAQAEHFGPKNQILNTHVATAVKNGEDAGALKNIISSYLHPATPKPGAVTTGLNAYQKGLRVVQLPRAAVSHLPQGFANTGADIGYTKYFKALGSKMFKDPEIEKLVAKSGLHTEDFGRHPNVSDRATAPGLAPVMRFHRDVAFRGGVSVAKGLAKNGDVQGLTKIGVDGKFARNADGSIKLTDTQLIKAGHFEANKSIGSHSTLESPAWTQTNAGKAVGMYRKLYTFKQAERIANMFKDARAGNPAPLVRYLAVGAPLAGAGVAIAKDEIKDPGSNPLADVGKFAGDTFHNSGAGSVGYGLVDSAVNAAMHNYGNDSRWSNLASAISPGAGFTVQTGQNLAKAKHGKPQALKREGLRMIPIGGTALANKLVPSTYDPNKYVSKNAASGGPNVKANSPTGKKLTLRQLKGNNPDELARWQGMTAKARANVRLNNPDKYVRDQNLRVQQEQAQGKTIAAFKDQRAVQQTQIQRNFDKNIVGAYGMNATDFKAFISQASQDQLNQLHSLDSQMVDAGLVAKSKFPKAKSPGSGGSRVASGGNRTKGSKGAKFTIPKIAGTKAIKAPKGIKIKSVGTFKQPKTRKLAVSSIPTTYKKKNLV